MGEGEGPPGDGRSVVHPPVKVGHTRLLDMIAGWSHFIQVEAEDGEVPDMEGVIDAVSDLYQEAGAMEDCSDDAVRAFVMGRVLPLLLRGGRDEGN